MQREEEVSYEKKEGSTKVEVLGALLVLVEGEGKESRRGEGKERSSSRLPFLQKGP